MLHGFLVGLEILQHLLFLTGIATRLFEHCLTGIVLGHLNIVDATNLGQQQTKAHTALGNGFGFRLCVIIHALIGCRMDVIFIMVMVMIVIMIMRFWRVGVHRAGYIFVFRRIERWRDIECFTIGERIQHILFQCLTQCGCVLAIDLACHSVTQRTQIIKAKTRSQLIINGNLALFAQFLDGYFKYSRLACQMCRLIILREVNSHIAGLTGFGADQAFFKARNKAGRPQFQRMTFCGTAFERLAIDTTDEIDHNDIPVFGSALAGHFNCWPVGISDIVQRLVDLGLAGFQHRLFNFQRRQIRHTDFRHDFAGQGSFQIFALVIGLDVDAWLAGKTQFIVFDSLARTFIQRILQRFALNLWSETGLHNRHRHLARAKPRHVHRCCQFGQLGGHLLVNFRSSD